MAKFTPSTFTTLSNEASAVSKLNSNLAAIATALENTLSRDGTSPNSMGADLDMNSNNVLNLPYPGSDTEPVRLGDIDSLVADAVAAVATGPQGATGQDGISQGFIFTYDATTSAADPGNGKWRFNNATLSSVTAAYIDNVDINGISTTAWLDSWDDNNDTSRRGYLLARDYDTPTTYAYYLVTGSVVDSTGYRTVTLSHVGSNGTFLGNAVLTFLPAGNKGADGLGTGDVVGPSSSVDGEIALFNSTTGKLIKRASTSGILKGASGVISAAAAGTDYQAPIGTISGVAKGNGANALTAATAGTDYMHPGTTSTITKGFALTPYSGGTVSSGTFTPDPANGNYQYYTNNGAHTLAVPGSDCAIDILVTNGASAGAITISGSYTYAASNFGDALTTTNTSKFIISIRRINGISTLCVKALQ